MWWLLPAIPVLSTPTAPTHIAYSHFSTSLLTRCSWPPLPCHTPYTSTLPGPASLEELCVFAASISSLLLPPQATPVCLCPCGSGHGWHLPSYPSLATFSRYIWILISHDLSAVTGLAHPPLGLQDPALPAGFFSLLPCAGSFHPSLSSRLCVQMPTGHFHLDILLEPHIQQIPNLPHYTSLKPVLTDLSISSSKSTKKPDLVQILHIGCSQIHLCCLQYVLLLSKLLH